MIPTELRANPAQWADSVVRIGDLAERLQGFGADLVTLTIELLGRCEISPAAGHYLKAALEEALRADVHARASLLAYGQVLRHAIEDKPSVSTKTYAKTCAWCGVAFEANQPFGKFCSPKHRNSASYAKTKAQRA